VNTLDL